MSSKRTANGIDKAVVLLSYPKDAFGCKKALRVFICSDLALSDGEILSHYTHRWKIEVMFKQQKMYMGLKLSTPFENVIFRRNGMSFFAGQQTGVYSLSH